jgi:hypothetical protein
MLAIGVISAWGCAQPGGGFDSPEPAARLAAITQADSRRDRSAIPHLIESLLHDDPVVRMAAIRTLEDLTGETHGYRYWDEGPRRERAARTWAEWYSGRTKAASTEAGGPGGSPADTGGGPPP